MSNWYRKVTNDMTQIVDCITYFEGEIEDAKRDIALKGGKTIERHAAELPGVVEHRYGQLQEVEAILEHLNISLRKKRAQVFKKFLEGYNKVLSSRDADKYVDGDDDVVDLTMLVNEFALLRNKFLSIHKGLDSKNWMLGHITRLRCAGLEDAQIE